MQRTIPGLVHVVPFARGAQALVFRGIDVEGRYVAIKLPSSDQSGRSELASRLRLESDLLRRLNHTRILRVLRDGVLPDGRPYMISLWLEGRTLEEERLSIERETLLNVLDDVLDAVTHAHRKRIGRRVGVVHRDLRPGNIMVTTSGRGVVLDFGAAKPLGYLSVEHHTAVGQWFGQSGYIAPEVVERGSSVAKRSADVYSLGTILHSFRAQLQDLGKPGQFQVLIDHCRAEREADRYRDAEELRAAFRAWRAHESVPRPERRVSREARYKAMQATSLPLVTVLAFSFGSATRSTNDWSDFLPESAYQALDPDAPAEVREWWLRVQDDRASAHLIPPDARSENVRAAQSVVTNTLQHDDRELAGVPLSDLFDAHFALARIDALYYYTEPKQVGPELPLVDRRVGGRADFCEGYWFPPEALDRVRAMRTDRDLALDKILQNADADDSLKLGFELFALLQDARMPQGEGPEFGLTETQHARLLSLSGQLNRLTDEGVPLEWLALAHARVALDQLWTWQATLASGSNVVFMEDIKSQRSKVRSALAQIPEGALLEAEMMRAELRLLGGN